jgi:hypothetical protein
MSTFVLLNVPLWMNVKQEMEKRSMVENQTSNWSWQTGREDNVKEQRRRPTTHRISRVPEPTPLAKPLRLSSLDCC